MDARDKGEPQRFRAESGSAGLQARAERRYASDRREAFLGMLVPSLVCLVIWVVLGLGFFWPVFVILGTGGNLVQTLVRRDEIIEGHVHRLENTERRELERLRDHRAGDGEDPA